MYERRNKNFLHIIIKKKAIKLFIIDNIYELEENKVIII